MPPNTKTLKGSGEEPKKELEYVTECPFCSAYDPDNPNMPEAGIIMKERQRCAGRVRGVDRIIFEHLSCAIGNDKCGFLELYCAIKRHYL